MTEEYEKLVKKYILIKIAGSDFHRKNTPDIELGMEIELEDIEVFLRKIFRKIIAKGDIPLQFCLLNIDLTF